MTLLICHWFGIQKQHTQGMKFIQWLPIKFVNECYCKKVVELIGEAGGDVASFADAIKDYVPKKHTDNTLIAESHGGGAKFFTGILGLAVALVCSVFGR